MLPALLPALSLARAPLGIACLVAGAVLARYAHRVPRRRVAAETFGGGLMVAGLALIGSGLPLFR